MEEVEHKTWQTSKREQDDDFATGQDASSAQCVPLPCMRSHITYNPGYDHSSTSRDDMC
jgi:hypothetical protein